MATTTVALSANPHRVAVLGLYRKLLKSAFVVDWKTDEDAAYVLQETRRLFRRNQALKDVGIIERKMEEAETRYGLAVHYRIPYPRMFHKPQGALPDSGIAHTPYLDSYMDGDRINPRFGEIAPGSQNARMFGGAGDHGSGYEYVSEYGNGLRMDEFSASGRKGAGFAP